MRTTGLGAALNLTDHHREPKSFTSKFSTVNDVLAVAIRPEGP